MGVTGRIDLGGSSISWSPKHHWQHTHLQPQAKWTTQVSGDASFSGSGSIAFVPSLMMHVDKIFTYAFTLSPQANLLVAGDTTTKKNLCERYCGYECDLQGRTRHQHPVGQHT